MSEYIVTARKWRPMTFEEVTGQSHVTVTLRNALSTKRLAHAYLFSGPRGVGKTTTARLLAKAVNCLHPVDNNPDNTCENCIEITEGRSFDVLEIDGASNRGVDEIRNLRESVRYAPQKGAYKVYIIDEVHMLTKEAFNALLKTLEEPPPHVLFIFATTEIHKVPATILSRCQRFDFRRIAIAGIMDNLRGIAGQEGIIIDEEALLLVAKKGDGSLRDAQSMFDQVVSLCGRKVDYHQILEALNIVDQEMYFRVTDLVKAQDARGGLALVDEIMTKGYDLKEFLGGLLEHLRNLLVAKTTGTTTLIEASDVSRKRYHEATGDFTVADLLRLQRLVSATEAALRWTAHPRFKLEADMVQMITMSHAPEVGELLQRIDELKKKVAEDPVPGIAQPVHVQAPSPEVSGAYRPPRMPPRPMTNGTRLASAAVAPAPQAVALAEAEVASRWQEFLAEVRRQRISLGSLLEGTVVLGVQVNCLRVGCLNEFQASAVTRNREFLAEIVYKVFHARARLDAEISSGRAGTPETDGAHGTVETPPPEHPVIAAMKRELGAEPL